MIEREEVPVSSIDTTLLEEAAKTMRRISDVVGLVCTQHPAYDESQVLEMQGAISLEWTWEKNDALMSLIADFVDGKIFYGLNVGAKNTEDWSFSVRHITELTPDMVEMGHQFFEKIGNKTQ